MHLSAEVFVFPFWLVATLLFCSRILICRAETVGLMVANCLNCWLGGLDLSKSEHKDSKDPMST